MKLSLLKSVALCLGVAGAILAPLYGDPRQTPVTHAEWARMLMRAVDLQSALTVTTQASMAFSILSWKENLTFAADEYSRAEGIELRSVGRRRLASATSAPGQVDFRIAIIRPGDYRLRLRLQGAPQQRAEAEVYGLDPSKPLQTLSVSLPTSAAPAWVDAGQLHLDQGTFTATVLMPSGTALERLEIVPPCMNPIEPKGGWLPLAITQTGDIAVTVIQALGREEDLPPAADPIELRGSDFQTADLAGTTQLVSSGVERFWLKAGPRGLRAVVVVPIPEDGLYALSVFGRQGGGQRWTVDSCHKRVLCPEKESGPGWHTVLVGRFSTGRHLVNVTLAPGATVERLRVERKKDAVADFEDTLRRLGFDVGSSGPIPRGRAIDAMEFIKSKRQLYAEQRCGELIEGQVPLPGARVASSGGPAGAPVLPPAIAQPGEAPPEVGGGSAPPPLSPPVIPPEEPASPVSP